MSQPNAQNVRHLAFIMDGNGRWAQSRGMPREFGHKEGAKVFRRLAEYCSDIGIGCVTTYALSTENLKNRSRAELAALFILLKEYLKDAMVTAPKNDTQVKIIGDHSPLPADLREMIKTVEQETSIYHKRLNIAVNYGGRDEIVRAVNRLIADGHTHITEEDIDSALDTGGCPPLDMIIRTGCEIRVSNFLLWQSAYSEYYFTDTLWPDLTEEEINRALDDFNSRHSRFGGA